MIIFSELNWALEQFQLCMMNILSDKNSKENVFGLKDNINYRLFATSHNYKILLKELYVAERNLAGIQQKYPNYLTGFLFRIT